MKTSLTSALNINNAKDQGLGLQAGQYLLEVESILNTFVDGVYVFAGGITDSPPVDLSLFTAAPDPFSADTSYYRGNDFKLNAQIDQSLNLKYGTLASEPAFEQYIRAFRIIQNDPIDNDNLRNALNVLNDSIDALIQKVSEIGSIGATINRIESKHIDAILVLRNTISGIEEADILEASTRLSAEETALQASYLTLSRLSRISLLNFLN
jgi:flagellar hook-associated protein 3 FlgL